MERQRRRSRTQRRIDLIDARVGLSREYDQRCILTMCVLWTRCTSAAKMVSIWAVEQSPSPGRSCE